MFHTGLSNNDSTSAVVVKNERLQLDMAVSSTPLIIDYQIVEHCIVKGLTLKVKELLNEGWQPIGQVGMFNFRSYSQVMVKYGEV